MSIAYKQENRSIISIHNVKHTFSWEGWLEWIRKCDFYAIVCDVWLFRFCFKNESAMISNFWKQIVVSTGNVVDTI